MREPPISMLMNLAKILNVTPNYLLTGEKTNNNEQQSEIKGVTVINSFASINVSAGVTLMNRQQSLTARYLILNAFWQA